MNSEETRERVEPFRLGLTLFIITAVVALVLAGVNAVTEGPIAEYQAAKAAAAMQAVMPNCTFSTESVGRTDKAVLYEARDAQGSLVGYCVEVAPNGYGGAIGMIVGVRVNESFTEKTVTGVSIVSDSETAGIGTKVKEDTFLSQFKGLGGQIAIGGENGIDAVSGATISSKAVLKGVNTALEAVNPLNLTGGGDVQ